MTDYESSLKVFAGYFIDNKNCFMSELYLLYCTFFLQLTMPSPMPEYLNVHYICESASRLLFLSMHWARSIPAFQALG